MIPVQYNNTAGTIHAFWKESLNSDGQQFHQFQQNEHITMTYKGNAKRGIPPHLKMWPWRMTLKINRVPDSLKD
jgi:hypothetical protein